MKTEDDWRNHFTVSDEYYRGMESLPGYCSDLYDWVFWEQRVQDEGKEAFKEGIDYNTDDPIMKNMAYWAAQDTEAKRAAENQGK